MLNINDKNLDGILEYIVNNLYRIPITFLGYKDFGFGENYKPKNIVYAFRKTCSNHLL